jgi:hypothetical protein
VGDVVPGYDSCFESRRSFDGADDLNIKAFEIILGTEEVGGNFVYV